MGHDGAMATRTAGGRVGLVAMLVLGAWLAMGNIAVSGLVVSNTLRGIEPVSLLFIGAVGCIVVYVGLVVMGARVVLTRQGSIRRVPRWLAARLLIVGFAFVGITVVALAVV